MSYPPLANGSYRVGDPPQRFPSASPGPSASPNLAPGGVYGYAFRQAAPEPAAWAPPTPAGAYLPDPHTGTAPVYPPAGAAPFAPGPGPGPGPGPTPWQTGLAQTNGAAPTTPAWGADLGVGVGAGPGADGAADETMAPPRPTGKRNLWIALGGTAAVAALVGAALLVAPTGGGSDGISAQGVLEIQSPLAVGGHENCYVPTSLDEAVSGDIEILSGSPPSVVSRVPLTYSDGSLGHCTFTFDYTDVPEDGAPYAARLGDFGVVDLSEQEVRDGISIVLGN